MRMGDMGEICLGTNPQGDFDHDGTPVSTTATTTMIAYLRAWRCRTT